MNYNYHTLSGMLRYVLGHPLNRDRKWAALWRYLRWHVGSRLVPGSVVMPWVNGARLVVRPRMHGATLAVYTGLPDFSEMGLLLHALRSEDLFVDVGANVGIYSVLVSAGIGARSQAYEPASAACAKLRDNLRINGIEDRVTVRPVAVGAEAGCVRFSLDRDANNRVLSDSEGAVQGVTVPCVRLDEEFLEGVPTALKIDVEGLEYAVLAGASRLLDAPTLRIVVVELLGGGKLYGQSDVACHELLLNRGFEAVRYDPRQRTLTTLDGGIDREGLNTVYVRGRSELQERLTTAPAFSVAGKMI